MRRRLDLGQPLSAKDGEKYDRKRQRWAERNKDRPDHENPFLEAIKPDNKNFGDPDESNEELRRRLENLEFGNFPGYCSYRNKSATKNSNPRNEKGVAPEGKGVDSRTKKPQGKSTCDTKPDSFCGNSSNGGEKSRLIDDEQIELSDSQKAPPASTPYSQQTLDTGITDERLGLMREEWFRGKDVLDIGCNRGHITYGIARMFSPKFLLGIDIDLKVINMANRDLHLNLEECILQKFDDFRFKRAKKLLQEGGSTYIEDLNQFPLQAYVNQGPIAVIDHVNKQESSVNTKSAVTSNSEGMNDKIEEKQQQDSGIESKKDEGDISSREMAMGNSFPNNIVFLEHNYVLSRDELVERQEAHFDTIVCLSVTKWIHLNYGDCGLKRFFKRIYRHLRVGGLLILEAQPFDNYGRRKKLSDRLRKHYYSIKFRPEQFDEYLLSNEIGFRGIICSVTVEHDCAGFRRPLKVFLK